jgi:hypothetical protein
METANTLMIGDESRFNPPEGEAAIYFWSNQEVWVRLDTRFSLKAVYGAQRHPIGNELLFIGVNFAYRHERRQANQPAWTLMLCAR